MSMELSVQGKNAIVTGAAGNIGEACVRALAAAGANVLVAGSAVYKAADIPARIRELRGE